MWCAQMYSVRQVSPRRNLCRSSQKAMPLAIKTPCCHRGCRELVRGRYCPPHAKAHNRERRKLYDTNRPKQRLYDTVTWRRRSKAYLRRHPLCERCQKKGRAQPATEVDHIEPHGGNLEKFWDTDNWQALCHSCHSAKTQREMNVR